ncbi:MAG: hypothetical protein AAGD38_01940 [Acidobacteriota bacterium]
MSLFPQRFWRLARVLMLVLAATVLAVAIAWLVLRGVGEQHRATAETRFQELMREHGDGESVPRQDGRIIDGGAVAFTVDEREQVTRWLITDLADWTDDDRTRIAEVLARRHDILVELRALDRLATPVWRGLAGGRLYADTSPLVVVLDVSRLLALDARLAASDGRLDDTVDDLSALGVITSAIYAHRGLSPALVGTAVDALRLESLRQLAGSSDIDDAILAALPTVLPDGPPDRAAIMAGEASQTWGAIQASSTLAGWRADLEVSAQLDFWSGVLDASTLPHDDMLEVFNRDVAPLGDRPDAVIAGMLIPNIREALRKLSRVHDAQVLAEVAFAVRLGRLDEIEVPEGVRIEPVADGRQRVHWPSIVERIEARTQPTVPRASLFDWTLPGS